MPKPKREPLKTFGRGPIWVVPRGYVWRKNGTPRPFRQVLSYSISSGLMFAVEDWMLAHPGQRLPTKEFAKKFNCTRQSVILMAKLFEKTHKLPKRKPGGSGQPIPRQCEKVLSGIVDKAKDGQTIMAIGAVRKIARETGFVLSHSAVINWLKKLAAEGRKNIVVKRGGLKEGETVSALITRLSAEKEFKGVQLKAFKVFRER